MSAAEKIPEEPMPALTIKLLETQPIWVAWQTEDRNGKPSKVPYNPSGAGRAKADAPSTWGSRAAAELRAPKLPRPYGISGVGINLVPLNNDIRVGGIDLDSCRSPETGAVEEWAMDIALSLNSYTEISPSQTGLKIFFSYRSEDLATFRTATGTDWAKYFRRATKDDHGPAIELHLGNRYFAVTDQIVPFASDEIALVNADAILNLIEVTGPAFVSGGDYSDDEAAEAISRQEQGPKPNKRTSIGRMDRSRSAKALSVGRKIRREGGTFDEMCAAIEADPETAAWYKEKGVAAHSRELVRIWDKAEPRGPTIYISGGQLHANASAGEQALLASGLPIFQRGNDLVRPVVQDVPAARGRMTVSAALHTLDNVGLQDALCGVAHWLRYDGRSEDWLPADAPRGVADIILSRSGHWLLPKVVGVISTPTIRSDGSILSEPGYDPVTRLYHAADPSVVLSPAVHQPTRETALKALALLNELLAEFPFVSDVSKAVALSGLITPVVRGALSVAPLHAFRANTAGTGKSYLVDTASSISSGRPCPVAAAGVDETETEKRLAGLLLAGFPIASLDNVNGELGGDLLCQAIERPLIRLRPLGRSDIMEVESRATLFATGNALRVRGDMVRRTIVCDLDAGMERPELRPFKGDPVGTVAENRGRYVSACLAIVRAYILAGCPDLLPPIASFEDWSGTVRSALVWLGCADPADSMEQAREDDPELAEIKEVMAAWRSALGTAEAFVVKELADAADVRTKTQMGEPTEYAHPAWRDCLLRLAGERGMINTKRLGRWLMNREGRIVDRCRIKRAGQAQGGIWRWALVEI